MHHIWTYHTYPNNRRHYMMVQVFWDMMRCRQFLKFQRIVIPSSSGSSTPITLCGLHDPEYEGAMILWNVWNCITQQHSTASTDLDCCSMFKRDYFSPLECNTMMSGEWLPTCARNVALSFSVQNWLAFEKEVTTSFQNVKKLFTQWQSITSWMTWNLSITAVRTSNLVCGKLIHAEYPAELYI